MDLFYNAKLVVNIYKANKNMRLQSNWGNMLITNKTQVSGYKPHVWFDQKYINKIFALKNLIMQYSVTYNSLDDMFIVYWY